LLSKLRAWSVPLFSSPTSTAGAEVEEVDPGQVEGLQIIKYPDPRLRAANEEITEFGPELQQLAKKMLKLMYAANGVGLAAPQVGVNKRLMVFNPGVSSTAMGPALLVAVTAWQRV
jgi:peptide deformylase